MAGPKSTLRMHVYCKLLVVMPIVSTFITDLVRSCSVVATCW